MILTTGDRVGEYDVVGLIGSGGMGQVYRARDSKLNRDVALKILPETFAIDPDRLSRFKREAQVLASLNHPNIAAIYGFEDSQLGETGSVVYPFNSTVSPDGRWLAYTIQRGGGPTVFVQPLPP